MTRRTAILSGSVWLALLGAWWLLSALENHPGTLWPSPAAVVSELWAQRSAFAQNAGTTLKEALLGFVVGVTFASTLALVGERVRGLSAPLQRVAVTAYSLPLIALCPVLVLWTGTGLTTKVVIAALACFFPVLVNLTHALRTTERSALELMYVTGASSWDTFRRVELPYALPALFASFTVAAPAAIVGALLAEWVGAESGLGIQMLTTMTNFDIPGLYASLIVASALSISSWALFTVVGRRLFPWHASLQPVRIED